MKLVVKSSALFALLLFTGCGGSGQANLVPANGVVTIKGKPAANIMVQFIPDVLDDSVIAPTSQALTDEAGKFELSTLKNEPGAVEGTHRVSLFDTLEQRPEQGERATKPGRLDPKYASGAISVDVVAGKLIEIEVPGSR